MEYTVVGRVWRLWVCRQNSGGRALKTGQCSLLFNTESEPSLLHFLPLAFWFLHPISKSPLSPSSTLSLPQTITHPPSPSCPPVPTLSPVCPIQILISRFCLSLTLPLPPLHLPHPPSPPCPSLPHVPSPPLLSSDSLPFLGVDFLHMRLLLFPCCRGNTSVNCPHSFLTQALLRNSFIHIHTPACPIQSELWALFRISVNSSCFWLLLRTVFLAIA